MLKWIILLFSLFSLKVNALQVKTATEGVILDFDISDKELTHIAIEGDRITGIKNAVDNLVIDREEEQGHLFIRVNGIVDKPIQAFILTEQGRTIGVRLTIRDIPIEMIKIKPYEDVPLQSSSSSQENITDLIRALYNQTDLAGYTLSLDPSETIPVLGMEAKSTAHLMSSQWLAIEYVIQNNSNETVELLESDFYAPNVRAVAIENKLLAPGEVTKVYIVKRL